MQKIAKSGHTAGNVVDALNYVSILASPQAKTNFDTGSATDNGR